MKRINDGHPLRAYLARLKPAEQVKFASDCGTTIGYLRKYLSRRTKPDVALVVKLSTHSSGHVAPADIRPDVDWDQVRRAIPAPRRAKRDKATAA